MLLFLRILTVLVLLGLGVFWWVTQPHRLPEDAMAGLTGDAERGAQIFAAGGCASCHAAEGAEGEERLVLTGGLGFDTEFGTFRAPNISPSDAGIGGWSAQDLANAMQRGVSPDGAHYFPAFPYTSYIRAEPQDIADLHAFLQTLPPSDARDVPNEIGLPYSWRRLLGGWKFLFLDDDWVLTDVSSPEVERGRYLVEALGHCAECHSPRNALGAIDTARWLGGAPAPAGRGTIPNITPGGLDWSEADIAEYLKSGFTPDYDVAGGEMAEVIANTAQLSDEDRAAIAAYLKAVPPVE